MYADQETGLYYNMARYYDPRIGRYISSDPIGLAGGLNTYSYAYNNPLTYIDPFGLCGEKKQLSPFKVDENGCIVGGPVAICVGPGAIESVGAKALSGILRFLENSAQVKNAERFINKIPVNAKGNVVVQELPGGGKALQATSPGEVPGSKAVYEKQIDAAGNTVQYTKTTYDPSGNIVHVKDKITGQTYP